MSSYALDFENSAWTGFTGLQKQISPFITIMISTQIHRRILNFYTPHIPQ